MYYFSTVITPFFAVQLMLCKISFKFRVFYKKNPFYSTCVQNGDFGYFHKKIFYMSILIFFQKKQPRILIIKDLTLKVKYFARLFSVNKYFFGKSMYVSVVIFDTFPYLKILCYSHIPKIFGIIVHVDFFFVLKEAYT